ncbi:MAG: TlpA family protein disulfide reductase [Acidobacteria bacterium]|nr:TlpA family protein disulfide reductase [Acidobacteriota bacterium]MCA1642475.1 TlpA family protein disulfide reductase [Acidobacteriota bacterium]
MFYAETTSQKFLTRAKTRPRALRPALVASLVVLAALATFAQQSDKLDAPRARAAEKSAAQLYEEAAGYRRRKYQELEREGFHFTEKIEAQVGEELRALAARNAAQLGARSGLNATDKFHLGLLQDLAGQPDQAIATLRAVAGDRSLTGEQASTARFVVATALARHGSPAEAETEGAEFLGETSKAQARRFQLETAIARGYRKSGERERAVTHGRAAFDAAKLIYANSRDLDAASRDEMFYRSGQFLAELLHELNRTGEAIAALQELRRLSVSFPSADLYRRASLILGRIVPAVGYMTKRDDPLFGAGARPAPEIEVKDWIDQKPTTLAAERGRVVLLDFWATWCVPCHAALPAMSDWQRRFKDRGLTIIAFTQYRDEIVDGRPVRTKREHDALRNFRRANRLPFGVAAAESLATAARYNVTSIPAAVLIDRRGVVRYLNVGSNDEDLKELEQMIVKLLDEPAEGGD